MRIALLTLTRGKVSGGFQKYLDHAVPLLRREPDIERVDVFVPPQMATGNDLTWPRGDELRGFRGLRRAVTALKPDVVFIATARALRFGSLPVVTMVQNMEPLEVPFGGNTVAEGLKNLVRAAAARAACRQSLARLANTRFLFTAGSIRPARGLEDAIDALSVLPEDVPLVIAGSADASSTRYAARMRARIEERSLTTRVHWAGQLDARSMAWCYRNASAFVMTSRAEACPNVVLEALAYGALSVSTTHPPMPEFFADAAIYYPERDASALAERLAAALALPPEERERLRRMSRARAALFPWQATARGTAAELRLAIQNSNHRR
jgi:hypothetical protein